jgi:hypothetical protein
VPSPLDTALAEAMLMDSRRDRAAAAEVLDAALASVSDAPAPLRFRALLLRAELAVDAGDLIAGRGWLAEARQVRLDANGKEALSVESRRADDLETFLTHRGCAG